MNAESFCITLYMHGAHLFCVYLWFFSWIIRSSSGTIYDRILAKKDASLRVGTASWRYSILQIKQMVFESFTEEMLTQFLYLYLPLLLLVTANIYFFAITAIRIYQAEKTNVLMMNGNSRRHTKYEKDRNRFVTRKLTANIENCKFSIILLGRFRLYLRLFTIMGVTWSLEIISWLVTQSKTSPSWLAYVLDVSNCLAGIVIFFLFVWKQRVRKLLVQRYVY